MGLSRDEAWAKLCEWTETPSLRKHARAVELVMRSAAVRYAAGEDSELFGLAGLLHDADYERWPEEHPRTSWPGSGSRGDRARLRHLGALHALERGAAVDARPVHRRLR